MLKSFSLVVLFSAFVSCSFAQTLLPSFFNDNMVLQQNRQVSVWGTDNRDVKVVVSGDWGKEATSTSDKNGHWKLKLQTPAAGGPYTLTIKGSKEILLKNVMIGEVWLCSGQSNMEMPVKGFFNQPVNGSNKAILNSKNKNIRMFSVGRNVNVSPVDDVEGKWLEANPSTVGDFSAVAYFFGRKLNEALGIPIGLIETAWGASTVETWMDRKTLSEFKTITIPDAVPENFPQKCPALLYNTMLNPLVGYTIKGAVWYQGESNREKAGEYKSLFSAMIQSWREKWQQGDFPFYFVQIAPFEGGKANAAFLREAQLQTMQTVINTGMAVILDIGNATYIHPPEKKPVGDRLAYWALAKNYNMDGISYCGPGFKKMDKSIDGKITLFFDSNANGLTSFGKELTGFEIAGEDKVFYPAVAKIKMDNSSSITVWTDKVKNPVSVRYAFKSFVEGTLFNTAGLPASSFRTDDWNE